MHGQQPPSHTAWLCPAEGTTPRLPSCSSASSSPPVSALVGLATEPCVFYKALGGAGSMEQNPSKPMRSCTSSPLANDAARLKWKDILQGSDLRALLCIFKRQEHDRRKGREIAGSRTPCKERSLQGQPEERNPGQAACLAGSSSRDQSDSHLQAG